MKSRFLLLSFIFSFFSLLSFSQNSQHVCGSYDGYLKDDMNNYPEFYKSLEERNNQLENQKTELLKTINPDMKNTGKKIIPVVVHVIHNFGSENVTDNQINAALELLNNNINGQDADFASRTPDVFAAVVGNPNIEFRLATIDPYGNPTSGINRVQSLETQVSNPRNSVKSISYC